MVPPAWVNVLKQLTAPDLDDRTQTFDDVYRLLASVDMSQPDQRDLLRRTLLPPLPSAEFHPNSDRGADQFDNTPSETRVLGIAPQNDTVVLEDVDMD